jgi:uncharacterized protein (TIGR02246 family)
MRTTWLGFSVAMAAALIAFGSQRKDEAVAPQDVKKDAAPASPDVKAVRDLVDSFVKAYNAKDAKAIAAQFVDDGRIVEPDGSVTEGREAIERRYRDAFKDNPDTKIEVTTENVRLLAPDVALEEGRAAIRTGDVAASAGRYHAIYVRRDGRWYQSSIYEFEDDSTQATPEDHLKDLEWLLGEWIDEGNGAVAHTNCHWDASKAFLIRDFDLKIGGRAALSGSQRIGWDPTVGQFRSWVFDSEGGYSEGRWTRDGDRWLIKNEGFVPDGRVVSATNIIVREGKDRVKWITTERTLGGDALDEAAEVILVRRPPSPK